MAGITRRSIFLRRYRKQATSTILKSISSKNSRLWLWNYQLLLIWASRTNKFMVKYPTNTSVPSCKQYPSPYLVNERPSSASRFRQCGRPSEHPQSVADRLAWSLYEADDEGIVVGRAASLEGIDRGVEEETIVGVKEGRKRGQVWQDGGG